MRGHAVLLDAKTSIAPFGEAAPEAFFAGDTVRAHQDATLARLGFSVVRAADPAAAIEAVRRAPAGAPVLLALDRIFFTSRALKSFLAAAKGLPRPQALALTRNASVDYCLPLQDVRREGELIVHDLLLLEGGASLREPSGEDPVAWIRELGARPLEVPKKEMVVELPLPTIGEGPKTKLRYPVTSTLVVSLEHWVHVLWLNQIAFGPKWFEMLARRPLWMAWRGLTALSFDRNRIADRMVARGAGSYLHPSAYCSASILGKNVRVGANATVRNSIVGDDTVIEDHAVLLNCTVGPRCLVTSNCFMVSCVSYPDATIGNWKLQVSLIGRGAYLNSWASFVDAKFVGHVKVEHKGELVSTERAFIGSVVGHNATVAAKVLIQPGRAVPNGTVVVMRPDEVVSAIPADLAPGVPHVRDHGTLVPLGQERSGP